MTVSEKIKVANVSDLVPLVGKKVVVKGEEIGLFLTEDNEIKAVNNVCPHKGGPLSEGTVSGDFVFCPLHDTKVDLCTGETPEEDYGCVQTYEVEVVDDEVHICL